jgi:sugar phosphate isomerase/epimerase
MAGISVQLYSVRDAFAADPAGTLARIRDAGFDQVEPFDLTNQADILASGLAAAGLTASSAHDGILVGADGDLDAVFDAADAVGVRTVIEPAVGEGWDDPGAIREIAARLSEAARRAAPRGIRIGYHNHWWEVARHGELTGLDLLAEHLDPAVVLEVDVYWAQVGGADPAALLRRLGERVGFLHVKDGPLDRDPESQLPPGAGSADLRGALAAAPTAVRVIEFDAYAGDLFEGIAEGRRFVEATDAARS